MRLRFVVMGAVSGLVLAGFGGAKAQEFRFAYSSDVSSLDPQSNAVQFTLGLLSNVYEGLVRYDKNLKIEPALATSWSPNSDATVWRFNLRKGVKFSNGDDFTADDAIFSYQRQSKPECPMNFVYAGVTEVRKIDDYTVDLVSKSPNPILPHYLTTGFMMDKKWAEKIGATKCVTVSGKEANPADSLAVGTGAFSITERVPGVRIVMEPNKSWWDKQKHNLTRAVFTPITDDGTRVSALLSGSIDEIDPVPIQDIPRVNANPRTKVLAGPQLRTVYLFMEQGHDKLPGTDQKNPFQDLRVRKALYQAINIEAIDSKIMGGLATPTTTLIPPEVFEGAKNIKRYPYDPAAAKKLLADAGYPNGFTADFVCPSGRYVNDVQICQAITAMAARVGINLNLTTKPVAQYFQQVLNIQQRDYVVGVQGWYPETIDSLHLIYNVLASYDPKTGGAGRYNLSFYSDPRIDELTKAIGVESDNAKRDAMIAEVYQRVHDNVYNIPLHQQSLAWGISSKVALEQRADGVLVLNSVTMK